MSQKISQGSTEMSSGYVSNSTSLNLSPKYASYGRLKAGKTRRTASFVAQPKVPNHFKANEMSAMNQIKTSATNEAQSRSTSRTSKSSGTSALSQTKSRRRSTRRKNFVAKQATTKNPQVMRIVIGRPSSRASSKGSGKIVRNTLHTKVENHKTNVKPVVDCKKNKENIFESNQNFEKLSDNVTPPAKAKKVYLLSWNPKPSLKITKPWKFSFLNLRKKTAKRLPAIDPKTNLEQCLPDSKNDFDRKFSLGGYSENTSFKKYTKNRSENQPSGVIIQTKVNPISLKDHSPPSDCSSPPRPPIWDKGSQESLSDEIPALSTLQPDKNTSSQVELKPVSKKFGSLKQLSSPIRSKSPLMKLIGRKLTFRSAEIGKHKKPETSPVYSRQPDSEFCQIKSGKSCENLSRSLLIDDHQTFPNDFQSLPRKPLRKPRFKPRCDESRLTPNGPVIRKKQNQRNKAHDFISDRNSVTKPKINNVPALHDSSTLDSTSVSDSTQQPQERPIQPIRKQWQSISQPSLFFPLETDPAEEPFTHYANLPFQLPARVPLCKRPDDANITKAVGSLAASLNQTVKHKGNSSHSDTKYDVEEWQAGLSKSRGSIIVKRQTPVDIDRRDIEVSENRSNGIVHVTHDKVDGVNESKSKLRSSSLPSLYYVDNTAPSRKQKSNKVALLLIGENCEMKSDEHFKHGDNQIPEGYIAIPGRGMISEKLTNVTNTHEEKENVREEEEVHHLGDYDHQDVQRAIRDGGDAQALVRRHQSGSVDSGGGGGRGGGGGAITDTDSTRALAPHHGLAPGQRRVVHEATRLWRTVDSEDVHEKSHRDSRGELHTETARTTQHEQFHNLQAPDDDSDGEDGSDEELLTSSKNRRHVRDVDMLEYYSVPRGGRLADGIKIGEGLRHVQENIEEDREGDDLTNASERMLEMRRQGINSSRSARTNAPLEYHKDDKTRHKHTHKWLENHFGSESGNSHSSEDHHSHRNSSARDYSQSRNVKDHRENSSEYRTFDRNSPKKSDGSLHREHNESYSRHVRETPNEVYIKEIRHGPHGDYESVEVVPQRAISYRQMNDHRYHHSPGYQDLKFELDNKQHKSTNRPMREVHFESSHRSSRRSDGSRAESPPDNSPPPPPPPRYKKKYRESRMQNENDTVHNTACYASSPVRIRYEHTPSSDYRPSRTRISSSSDTYDLGHHSKPNEMVDHHSFNYHDNYKSKKLTNGKLMSKSHMPNKVSSSRSQKDLTSGSTPRPSYYLGEDPHAKTSSKSMSMDHLHRSSPVCYRVDVSNQQKTYDDHDGTYVRNKGHYHPRTPHPKTYNEDENVRSQTMPRKIQVKQKLLRTSPLASIRDRFGGSMVNVSNGVSRKISPLVKPTPLSVQRSNSMYLQSGCTDHRREKLDLGLKSPNIISKIQRSASMKKIDDETDSSSHRKYHDIKTKNANYTNHTASENMNDRSPRKSPPHVLPKPKSKSGIKENFMKGLMQKAPELYGVLHGEDSKDRKTPPPKNCPPTNYYHHPLTPTSPLGIGREVFPKTPPVFKRLERLRADEEVVTEDNRSRSNTPIGERTEAHRSELHSTGDRPSLHRYSHNDQLYTAPSIHAITGAPPATAGRRAPSSKHSTSTSTSHFEPQSLPRRTTPHYIQHSPRQDGGGVVIEVRDWKTR